MPARPAIRLMALPAPRVFTADDLSLPPYRDLNCALWDGTLLVHDGHGGCSGPVAARIVAKLLEHVDDVGLGWVGDSGTGFRLRRNPDRVLVPDASFTSRSRLAAWPAKGPREVVPNLVAEVRSPNDSWTAFVAKGGKWLAHGVEVVWLVDPGERTATTLRETGDPVIVSVENALSGAPALPNLTIPLADLLQGLT